MAIRRHNDGRALMDIPLIFLFSFVPPGRFFRGTIVLQENTKEYKSSRITMIAPLWWGALSPSVSYILYLPMRSIWIHRCFETHCRNYGCIIGIGTNLAPNTADIRAHPPLTRGHSCSSLLVMGLLKHISLILCRPPFCLCRPREDAPEPDCRQGGGRAPVLL